jgi:hypothetical protein
MYSTKILGLFSFLFHRIGTTRLTGKNAHCKGPPIFQKYNSHLQILGARMVTSRKLHRGSTFCTYGKKTAMITLKILGATTENLVARATTRPGFVQPFYGVLRGTSCFSTIPFRNILRSEKYLASYAPDGHRNGCRSASKVIVCSCQNFNMKWDEQTKLPSIYYFNQLVAHTETCRKLCET